MSRRLVTSLCTGLALIAFAANSIFCRLALGRGQIDPVNFTLIRLGSGALTLFLILAATRRPLALRGSWAGPALLLAYAAGFSFAYVSLSAGTGALLLFASVQTTMLVLALRAGERFRALEGVGLFAALAGLVYLVLPGLSAPSPVGCTLMVIAGMAWGGYSIRGRGSADALGDTARNFMLATPLIALASAATVRTAHVTAPGVMLAIASGALTSGIGYVVWFAALRGLSAIRAAMVQLAVPALAAAGGVVFLSERVTLRIVLAGVLILGGVAMAIAGRRPSTPGVGEASSSRLRR